jgi:hypothetical protein
MEYEQLYQEEDLGKAASYYTKMALKMSRL